MRCVLLRCKIVASRRYQYYHDCSIYNRTQLLSSRLLSSSPPSTPSSPPTSKPPFPSTPSTPSTSTSSSSRYPSTPSSSLSRKKYTNTNATNDPNKKHVLSTSDVLTALNDKIAVCSTNTTTDAITNATKAFTMIESNGLKPNLQSYNNLLKAYANATNVVNNNNSIHNTNSTTKDALQYYSKMLEQKIRPNNTTYSALIEILLQSHNNDIENDTNDNDTNSNIDRRLESALEFFYLSVKTSKTKDKYLDKRAFDLLFKRLVNSNENLAISIIKGHITDKTAAQYANWLLVLLSKHLTQQSTTTNDIFEIMMKYKVYPSYTQVMILFQSIKATGDADRAARYWKVLKDNQYRHLYNNHLVNSVINTFRVVKKYNEAIRFYEQIIGDKKYRPDKNSIALIISIHGNIGNYMGAVKYYEYYINETPLSLSSQTLPVALSNSPSLPSSSSSSKNLPDLVIFNALIDAHANSKNVHGALYYYHTMMNDYGLQPDTVTYTSIMKAYELVGDTKDINNMFNTMISTGVKVNIQTIDTIIRAYAKTGDVSEALRYFNMLEDYDLKPTSYTLSAVISAHAKIKDKEGVAKYFMMMYETYKLQPHISMINGVLMTWIGYDGNFTFDDIDEILKFLDLFKLSKDSHIYYQLLLACKIKNDIDRAYNIFDEIIARADIGMPVILYYTMRGIIGDTNFDEKYKDVVICGRSSSSFK